jgi:superfamily II DNA/RNA helicase
VDDVSFVVHVDAPVNYREDLHRACRTARAGAFGKVVTLATHKQRKGDSANFKSRYQVN